MVFRDVCDPRIKGRLIPRGPTPSLSLSLSLSPSLNPSRETTTLARPGTPHTPSRVGFRSTTGPFCRASLVSEPGLGPKGALNTGDGHGTCAVPITPLLGEQSWVRTSAKDM
jgi:hypothetical protein